jgi:hypothetical protein
VWSEKIEALLPCRAEPLRWHEVYKSFRIPPAKVPRYPLLGERAFGKIVFAMCPYYTRRAFRNRFGLRFGRNLKEIDYNFPYATPGNRTLGSSTYQN